MTMPEGIEPQTLDDLTDVMELLFESGWTDGLSRSTDPA